MERAVVYMELNKVIVNEITSFVRNNEKEVKYRKPIIGFADANNPKFLDLKKIIKADHYLPKDLLSSARSVVSFFLPFTRDLVDTNQNHSYISKEWAIAYVETNELIDKIVAHMKNFLISYDVKCSDNPARETFDKEILMHRWSQRHIARICGLGSFGINNMLITKSGCAGRYGSFVIDTLVDYDEPITEEYCLYKKDKSCKNCITSCPTGALTIDGFDRHRCYTWLKEVNDYYSDLDECDVCGKCIIVPCAFEIP